MTPGNKTNTPRRAATGGIPIKQINPPPIFDGGGGGGETVPIVAVVGRPNAGKSTLINAAAGHKAAIVSRRRQTTRASVRALCERNGAQFMLADTPGWQAKRGDSFNRALNAGAERAAGEAAAIIFTVPALCWGAEENRLLEKIGEHPALVVAANKTDLLSDRNLLLPFFAKVDEICKPRAIVPVCALKNRGVGELLDAVIKTLPPQTVAAASAQPSQSPMANITTAEKEFLFAEALREKLFIALGEELPYRAAVLASCPPRRGRTLRVDAEIFVEKESQKAIVVGAAGAKLKKLASAARRDMEKIAGEKVFLAVRVRAKKWRQDKQLLAQMRVLPSAP